MFQKKFVFGTAREGFGNDITRVQSGDLYQPDNGYGFVIEKNRREQELLKIPELNSAFDTIYWYQDEDLTHIEQDSRGCFLDSDKEVARLEEAAGEPFKGEHRRIPLTFKFKVPHPGNYKVTVAIYVEETLEDVMIFSGRRRLEYKGVIVGPVEDEEAAAFDSLQGRDPLQDILKNDASKTMMVNVCDIIPRGHTDVYEDNTIDITIVAKKPRITHILVEEVECPTIYIAGDSTVTDQSAEYPYAPGTSYCGWGQMLSAYLSDRIAVSNHAHSGLTTDSFRKEGHYGIVQKYCKEGDYIFYQFGHNDQKLDELKAQGGYRENLVRYIHECREMGAYPVLVSPLARNTWKGNDGTYNDLLEEYGEVCYEVAEQEDVPYIDLHFFSMDFIFDNGLEGSKPYFFPGDYTHSNDYGAYFMAGIVAREIAEACGNHADHAYHDLARCVTKNYGKWEPAPEIVLPVKPKKYEDVKNPAEGAKLLSEVDKLSEPADRVSVLDMIIKTVRFFPTNVYNDMFTDVVGHEWYAGTVECAYQNGMIDEGLVEGQEFKPLQPVTLEEFLVFAVNGYKSRKEIPLEAWEKPCAYDAKCRGFAKPYVRAACVLGFLAPDGNAELSKVLTRGEAVELCRKMGI